VKEPYNLYGTCRHWRQRVRVGRTTVTCSSYFGNGNSKTLEPIPDFGIYLSTVWKSKLSPFWTSGAYLKSVARLRAYPALVVDWADVGVVKVNWLRELVEICLCKMRQGKRIDIGCAAGHGRTGTLLACLIAKKEHLSAVRAMSEVYSRYCHHAIETRAQEDLVREYVENLLKEVEASAKRR